MMTMRRHPAALVFAALLAAGAVTALAQQPASPQRGASGPPEHAKVTPVNNLPNPYETVRNWGTLPDGRRWGSVSAVHVDIDGKHDLGRRSLRHQFVRRARRSTRSSSSTPAARSSRASGPG